MNRIRLSSLLVLFCLMGTVTVWGRPGDEAKAAPFKPALLVIDIQNAYLPMMDQRDLAPGMENINALIELFRKHDFPVIQIYHTDMKRGPKPGSEEFAFPQSVTVRDDDPRVIKNYPNAFIKTDLDKILKEKGCNTLYLSGLSSVGCVLATYFGATERAYDTFMVGDAIISHNAEYTDFIRKIVPAPALKTVALQLKVLSGDLKLLESLPTDALTKDYGITSPDQLNGLGYMLFSTDRLDDAITVFKTNTRLFPDEPNGYDSLGEALEYNNQTDLALANYEKACQKAREKNDKLLETYEKNRDRLKGAGK